MAIHQVFALGVGIVGQAQLPQRQLEMRFLGVVRVETHGHQNEVRQIRRALAEVKNVVVPGQVRLETEMRLQRRVLSANAIELGDLRDDVAGCVIVAYPDLVLLRIQELLLDRNGGGFEQFEA